jgi:hypothetical protein
MAALGLVLWFALLLWCLSERQMREDVKTTDIPLTEWDQNPLERPAACMMMTKFSGVLVRQVSPQRQPARPLSAVQQQYLLPLRVTAS